MTEAATYYHSQIATSGWLGWLYNRGISWEAIVANQLGYVGQPMAGDERYAGALVFPYFNALRTDVMLCRYRHPDGHKPKYESPSGGSALLYGPEHTEDHTVCVTEGELDAIVLRQLGFAAVGVPGASAFQPEWRFLFRDCERVLVCFDGDDAGAKGASKIARVLNEVGPVVRSVELPQGEDINSLFLKDEAHLRGLLS